MYDIYNKLGTNFNRRLKPENYKGYVTKATAKGTISIRFSYGVEDSADYEVQTSAMPGHGFNMPTETIRTTRTDINFAINDKITLQDGRTLTVRGASYEDDQRRAISGNAHVAWILTLRGGNK